MDICVLNPFFYPYSGGTERVLLEVYKRLVKNNNITVVSASLNDSSKTRVDHVNGIKVVRVATRYIKIPALPMPFPIMIGLREAINKERAQIYHINNRYLYFQNSINEIRKVNGKIALTLHDALPRNINAITDNGGYLYDLVWGRKMMEYSDVITAVSSDTVRTTVPENCRKRTFVIYNGVDYKRFKHRARSDRNVRKIAMQLDIENNSINVINNGRLIAQKGQVYIIRAFANIMRNNPGRKFNLVIIGRGYLKDYLMYMAKDLGISKNVKIIGGIEDRDIPYYYNLGDVFVSGSLYEPASIAVMEALASETPVVATRVGGVPEMMKENGLYVKARSISGIEERINETISDKLSARKRAVGGRMLIKKEHDWNNISKRYEDVFSSVVA